MIESERLLLRPHTIDDYKSALLLNSDPEVMLYIGSGKAVTAEESWTKLLRNVGHWSVFGYGLFAAFEKATGSYIGDTGLAHFHRGLGDDFDPYPETAWMFVPQFHGKGYALEAANAVHRWFAKERNPKRTVCIIDPANGPSIRLAEKLGYTRLGEADYRDKTVVKFEKTAF